MKKRRRFLALLMAAAIFTGQTLGSTAGVLAEESGAQSGLTVTADAPSGQEAQPAAEAEQTKPQLEDDAASQADEQAAEAVQEGAADAQTDSVEDELAEAEELIPEDAAGQEVLTDATDTIAVGPEDGSLVVESVQEAANPMLADAAPEEYIELLDYPGSGTLLPGECCDFGKENRCHIVDADHPDGAELGLSAEMPVILEGETLVDVMTSPEDDSRWRIQVKEDAGEGRVKVQIPYMTEEGEYLNPPYEFKFDVASNRYCLDAWSDTGSWKLQQGETMALTVEMWQDTYELSEDGEDSFRRADVSAVDMKLQVPEDFSDVITVTKEEDATEISEYNTVKTFRFTITAHNESCEVPLIALLTESEDSENPVYKDQIATIVVSEDHWRISATADQEANKSKLPYLEPGRSVTFTPGIEWKGEGSEEPEEKPTVRFATENWNPDALEVKADTVDEEGYFTGPFTLKKLQNEDGVLWLIAEIEDENGDFIECDRMRMNFRRVDYSTYFEEDDYYKEMYTDGSASCTLQGTEKFAGYDALIECEVGNYEEDGWHDLGKVRGITWDPETYMVTVDGSMIPEELLQDGEANFEFRFLAKSGEYEEEIEGNWIRIFSTVENYDLPAEEEQYLPGWSYRIDPTLWVYVENSAYPDGRNTEVKVKNVQVSDPDKVLEFTADEAGNVKRNNEVPDSGSDDEGWNLNIKRSGAGGTATVTITYELWQEEGSGAEPKTDSYTFDLVVQGEIYELYCTQENNSEQVRVGETQEIETTLWKRSYNIDEDEHSDEEISEYTLEYEVLDPNKEDAVAIEVDEQTHMLRVTGLRQEYVTILVTAKIEGEPVASTQINVDITETYYVLKTSSGIEPGNQPELQLGEVFHIGEPELWRYSMKEDDNGDLVPDEGEQITSDTEGIESVDIHWEEPEPDCWRTVGDENAAEDKRLDLVRTTREWSELWLTADIIYEDSEEREPESIPFRYFFDRLDYNLDFSYSYGSRENSGLYYGEPLTLSLTGVPEKGDYTVDWQVKKFAPGEEGEGTIVEQSGDNEIAWEMAEDGKSITLEFIDDGSTHDEDYQGSSDLSVYATLRFEGKMISEDPNDPGTDTWIGTRYPDYRLDVLDGSHSYRLVPGKTLSFAANEDRSGYMANVYVQNSKYPDGLLVPVLIKGITSENPDVVKAERTEAEYRLSIDENKELDYEPVQISITLAKDYSEEYGFKEEDLTFAVCPQLEAYYAENIRTEGEHANENGEMLPGSKMTVSFDLVHEYYKTDGEDRGFYRETIEDWSRFALELERPKDWDWLVQAEVNDSDHTITVTADEIERGSTYIPFLIRKIDEDTENIEVENGIDIKVTGVYYTVSAADPLYLEPGKSCEPEIMAIRHSISNPDGEEYSGLAYELTAYDANLLSADGMVLTANENVGMEEVKKSIVKFFGRDSTATVVARGSFRITICRHELKEVENPKANCVADGLKTVTCSKCGYNYTEVIKAKGHDYQGWKTLTPATVTAPEQQQGTCRNCGATSTRSFGAKLTAFARLNVTSLPLKVKQSTKVVKVEMAAGDSIVSWTSSNKKVATVSASGKITGKKKGKATITVTLASGKTASVKIKVQTPKVTTKKIKGVAKKLTLTKGQKLKLTPELYPLTSVDKIKYTSSNKKVATVDKKGNIKAKKNGTAKITVRSGKKKFVCKVTVK